MSASADTVFKKGEGRTASYPVTAATKLYQGSMISVVDGNAKALADGEKFVGHCVAQIDNLLGLAGALNVETLRGEEGKYSLQVALPKVNALMVGAYVYAIDDNTYTLAPMRTPVGKVVQFVSTGVALVEFDVNLSRQSMNANGVFMPFRTAPVGAASAALGTQFIHTVVDGDSDAAHYIKGISAARSEHYNSGIIIHTNDKAGDGSSIQLNGEPFYLDSASKPFFFGTRLKLSDVVKPVVFVGIAITDTTLTAGCTDDISFRKLTDSAEVKLYVEKNNTETVSGAAEVSVVNDTYVNLAFVYDGTNVIPFVNGAAGTALAVTNLPNDELLTLSIEILNVEAAVKDLTIAFVDAYQLV